MATEANTEDDAQRPKVRKAGLDQLGDLDGTATVTSRPRHTIAAQGNSLSLATCTTLARWLPHGRPFESRPHDVRSVRRSTTAPVTDAETSNADIQPSSTSNTWRRTRSSGRAVHRAQHVDTEKNEKGVANSRRKEHSQQLARKNMANSRQDNNIANCSLDERTRKTVSGNQTARILVQEGSQPRYMARDVTRGST